MTLPELCSPNPRYTHTVFWGSVCLPWLPPQAWSDLLISVKQKREASWTGALVLLLRKVNWSGFTACQHLIFTLGSFWTWIHRQGLIWGTEHRCFRMWAHVWIRLGETRASRGFLIRKSHTGLFWALDSLWIKQQASCLHLRDKPHELWGAQCLLTGV